MADRPFEGPMLLVDDERIARTVGARMLERLGFAVETACDGPEAIALFTEDPGRFVGAMLDLTMPKMDGDVCLRELRRIRADLPVVLASGYHEGEIAAELVDDPRTVFIQKPYRAHELEQKLHQLLG